MARTPPGLGHLLVGQPEVGERLQRALNVKGPLPHYTEDLYGLSVTAEDLTRAEYNWLRRMPMFAAGRTVAALAGNFSVVTLLPATGAGRVLAAVQGITLSNPNAAAITVCIAMTQNPTNFTTGAIGEFTGDDRGTVGTVGTGIPSYALAGVQQAVAPFTFAGALQFDLLVNTSIYLPIELCLTNKPIVGGVGTNPVFLMVGPNAVNTAIRAGFIWRERSLLASEL